MRAWENFLKLQEKELGEETVQKWLKSLKVANFDACNLFLEAADTFQIAWFDEHVRKSAHQRLLNNNHKRIKVHLSVSGAPPIAPRKKGARNFPERSSLPFSILFDALDPHCLFENFIAAENNELAYQLICKTAGYGTQQPALNVYNPIYVYGGSGCGKTHLLMAAAHTLREQGISVIYTRTETFTEHVVTAIRAGEMSQFRQSYRNVDVLIIDDVHLFGRKTATQEELFHTFNTLHVAGKQIILGANCTPAELSFIEPRLVSRFEWGIVAPINVPSKNTLRHIILAKAAALQCEIPPAIVDLLIDLFPSGPKALVRALEALLLRSHYNDRSATPLTIPLVRRNLADLIEEEQRAAMTPDKIIRHVAEFYGVLQEEMLGKSQSRECVTPRQIAMYFCRAELELPYARIGEIFGRDHSTVMSSIKLIQKGIDSNDPNLAPSLHAIQRKLKN